MCIQHCNPFPRPSANYSYLKALQLFHGLFSFFFSPMTEGINHNSNGFWQALFKNNKYIGKKKIACMLQN